MANRPPVNVPSGATPQRRGGPQAPTSTPTGPGGYVAQGPAGVIQGNPSVIGATAQGANAVRSGTFAAPRMSSIPQPLLQGGDTTLGAGRTTGTYAHMFANTGYANGGEVGALPAPQQTMPQQQGGQEVDPRMVSMELQGVAQANPQFMQQVQMMAPQMKINPENAEQVGQMALLALQKPELYPQIRQYAIQSLGLSEQDLPPEINPQFLAGVLFIANNLSGGQTSAPPPPDVGAEQAMAQEAALQQPQGQAPAGPAIPAGPIPQQQQQLQPQQQQPQLATGGEVDGPGTGTSDSVPANLSDGEFVIPADVVRAKGTDFFNKLLDQYHTPVNEDTTRH